MKANPSTYILSPIDHKKTVELTPDLSIYIDKSYENNLRERNPQLGTVEGICDDNPYNLKVGDIVAVNHRTFYGNIGENKGFIAKDHFEIDGKKYFKVLTEQIFFKYNNKTPELLGAYIICEGVKERVELKMEANKDLNFYRQKEFKQRGTIMYGDEYLPKGTEVLVLKNAFYLITLDRIDYFKVRKDEVVAKIINEEAIPVGKHLVIEYVPEITTHAFLDLSMVKKPNTVKAKVLSGPSLTPKQMIRFKLEGNPVIGETILAWRNQGVEFNGKRIIDSEMIVGVYEEA